VGIVWESLKEYFPLLFTHLWVCYFVAAGIIGWAIDRWEWVKVPGWAWKGAFYFALLAGPFMAFHEIRQREQTGIEESKRVADLNLVVENQREQIDRLLTELDAERKTTASLRYLNPGAFHYSLFDLRKDEGKGIVICTNGPCVKLKFVKVRYGEDPPHADFSLTPVNFKANSMGVSVKLGIGCWRNTFIGTYEFHIVIADDRATHLKAWAGITPTPAPPSTLGMIFQNGECPKDEPATP
jgi:hypothetical protein